MYASRDKLCALLFAAHEPAAGSFAFLDPDMHHYAMAVSDAVVQIHGTAPVQFNYINPQDDPSKK
jgi:hypothetical protein